MPKTKFQGLVFGLLMSYFMAYGMEVYNVAIKMGYASDFSQMSGSVFLAAFKEALYMGLIVFAFSNLFGNRLGAKFAARHVTESDNPYFCMLMRQAGTVAVMCPSMSLAASILFNVILGGSPVSSLPAIWVGTLIKNFPMALCWNMFAAAPLTRLVFSLLFTRRNGRHAVAT